MLRIGGVRLCNVKGVISSGNVVFETSSKDIGALETKIEAAWPKKLGFTSTTIVRSQQQLERLVQADPYKGALHNAKNYQLVTFFKKPPKIDFKFPFQPLSRDYRLLKVVDDTLFSVIDTTATGHSPDLMAWLEKQFGKEITSRTYKTIQRILKKME